MAEFYSNDTVGGGEGYPQLGEGIYATSDPASSQLGGYVKAFPGGGAISMILNMLSSILLGIQPRPSPGIDIYDAYRLRRRSVENMRLMGSELAGTNLSSQLGGINPNSFLTQMGGSMAAMAAQSKMMSKIMDTVIGGNPFQAGNTFFQMGGFGVSGFGSMSTYGNSNQTLELMKALNRNFYNSTVVKGKDVSDVTSINYSHTAGFSLEDFAKYFSRAGGYYGDGNKNLSMTENMNAMFRNGTQWRMRMLSSLTGVTDGGQLAEIDQQLVGKSAGDFSEGTNQKLTNLYGDLKALGTKTNLNIKTILGINKVFKDIIDSNPDLKYAGGVGTLESTISMLANVQIAAKNMPSALKRSMGGVQGVSQGYVSEDKKLINMQFTHRATSLVGQLESFRRRANNPQDKARAEALIQKMSNDPDMAGNFNSYIDQAAKAMGVSAVQVQTGLSFGKDAVLGGQILNPEQLSGMGFSAIRNFMFGVKGHPGFLASKEHLANARKWAEDNGIKGANNMSAEELYYKGINKYGSVTAALDIFGADANIGITAQGVEEFSKHLVVMANMNKSERAAYRKSLNDQSAIRQMLNKASPQSYASVGQVLMQGIMSGGAKHPLRLLKKAFAPFSADTAFHTLLNSATGPIGNLSAPGTNQQIADHINSFMAVSAGAADAISEKDMAMLRSSTPLSKDQEADLKKRGMGWLVDAKHKMLKAKTDKERMSILQKAVLSKAPDTLFARAIVDDRHAALEAIDKKFFNPKSPDKKNAENAKTYKDVKAILEKPGSSDLEKMKELEKIKDTNPEKSFANQIIDSIQGHTSSLEQAQSDFNNAKNASMLQSDLLKLVPMLTKNIEPLVKFLGNLSDYASKHP